MKFRKSITWKNNKESTINKKFNMKRWKNWNNRNSRLQRRKNKLLS